MADEDDQRIIPKQSDDAANARNVEAIERAAGTSRYRYIVAWGKFLGFTPATVCSEIEQAEADNAPVTAIQKLQGRWHTIEDITNDTNRARVIELARGGFARER